MSKHSNARFNLQAEIKNKFARRMVKQAFNGDQISVKSKDSNTNKTPVYVHQFSKNLRKGSLYSNGFQGFFDEKSSYLKSKFDALSLTNDQGQQYTPINTKNKYIKCPVHQSKINMRIRGFEGVDKTVLQKIEEDYWSNWKPNNGRCLRQTNRPIFDKIEENVNKKIRGTPSNTDKPVEIIHKAREAYDSKSSELLINIVQPEDNSKNKDVEDSEKSKVCDNSVSPPTIENNKQCEDNQENTLVSKNPKIEEPIKLNVLQEKLSKTITPHLTVSDESSASHKIILKAIRHTDSLILTTRKQQQAKDHYQQPKCIKLNKKECPVLIKDSRNYIKGGTYPLKPCLKQEKPIHKTLLLGKPGSSIILGTPKKSSQKKLRKKLS